ncbi:MAG: FxsA family protein [Rhodospirillaceae bacterium]|nr:FxsA family protein [Rhodospirillaceae bacterium]
MLGLLILLLFIAVPLIEIGLFIEVGGWVGGWTTVGLVILTAVVGLTLVRIQGLGVLKKFNNGLNNGMEGGTFPVGAAFDGIALFIAGAMLLTPGFMTDILGFLLLIPPLRAFLGSKLQARAHFSAHTQHAQRRGHPQYSQSPKYHGGEDRDDTHHNQRRVEKGVIIEGEFEEIKKDDGQ